MFMNDDLGVFLWMAFRRRDVPVRKGGKPGTKKRFENDGCSEPPESLEDRDIFNIPS